MEEAQQILRDYKINPIQGQENLVWAPNIGHTDAYAIAVRDELRALAQAGASRQQIIDKLNNLGERFIKGEWKS